MTTIDALKNLYVELGGNLEDVENINFIPKMIDALSEIAGSTIELPGVTAEDNGDVLTVVEGKWAKAAAGGGSSLPEVTADDNGDVLTVVEGEWAKATPDKNYNRIYQATVSGSTVTLSNGIKGIDIYNEFTNGKNVCIKIATEFYFLEKATSEYITFVCCYFSQQKLHIQELFINKTDSNGTYTENTFTPDA